MWLCHDGGSQPPQTSSHIHIHTYKNVWAHWYAVHRHMVATSHRYTHRLGSDFGALGHLRSQMLWLCHGWGWQPPNTASHIHIRHIQSVWAHWYAAHGHTVSALHSYTHPTLLRFWGSGSLVESKWCHCVMVEAHSHLKLFPTSILEIYKVFEHIDMLFMDIQ